MKSLRAFGLLALAAILRALAAVPLGAAVILADWATALERRACQ